MNCPKFLSFLGLMTGVLLLVSCENALSLKQNESVTHAQIITQSKPYFCQIKNQNPTLFGRSELGNVEMIIFKKDMEGKKPLERCHELANKLITLESKHPISYLSWMTTPQGKRYIIVTKYEGYLKRSSDNIKILFPLTLEDKPHEFLDSLKGILSSSGHPPIDH